MEGEDIRWKQRFSNFTKALLLLEKYFSKNKFSTYA
jgi:hypothetical protein